MKKRLLSTFMALAMLLGFAGFIPSGYVGVDIVTNAACSADSIVTIAINENGNGSSKYTSYMGISSSAAWCASFVSWCAKEAGATDIIYKSARCTPIYTGSKGTKHWVVNEPRTDYAENNKIKHTESVEKGYQPKAGDLIFFDWSTDSYRDLDHIGIVESYNASTGTIYTIEGNRNNKVVRGSRPYDNTVTAFFTPNYDIDPIDTPVDNSYEVPCKRTATKKYDVYDRYGNAEYDSSGVRRYIAQNDECTIHEVYGSGYVKVTYPVGSGTHTAYAKNDGWGLVPINVNHDPIGVIDRIEGGAGKINVYGWTYDPDNSSKSLEIHVYIGGSAGSNTVIHSTGGIMANADSPDVNSAYNINGKHRFNTWIETTARGNQPVYVYAINNESGNNPCIGSGTVNIAEPIPQGSEMTSGAGQTIPDGDYIIVSELGRRIYLDIPEVAYPAPEGIDVTVCNGATLPGKNDLFDTWTVKYLDNGYYKIIQNEKCGKEVSLDVKNDSKAVGTEVMTHYYHGGHNQQWSISETSHGYRIQSRSTSWYLDVRDAGTATGTKVQMCQAIAGDKAQAWGFIPIATDDRPVADGTYKIKSECGDVYLDAYGHANTGDYVDGTNIDIALSKNDSFNIAYVDDGFYTLREASTGLAVEVEDEDKTTFLNKDKNIQLGTFTGERRQLWKIVDEGNGKIRFVSKLSGYSLDLAGMKTENGSNVQQHPYNTSNAQKWTFEKVHKHTATKVAAKAATCTTAGNTAYWYCSGCKKYFSDSACTKEITLASTVVKATGHKWNNVTYTWSTDNKTCTATRICANNSSHNETETVNTKYSVTKEPTYTDKGTGTYTATFKNTAFAKQTKGVELQPIPNPTPKVPELTATATEEKVTLKWKPIANAEKYGIAGYVNGKWKLLDECCTISYELKNLKPGTKYKVAVVAMFDGKWNLDFSNAVEFIPPIPIPKITYEKGNGSVKLTWTAVSTAEKYGIFEFEDDYWNRIAQTTDTSYVMTGLASGSEHKIAVVTYSDGNWNTDFSNAVIVSPNAPQPVIYPKVSSIDHSEEFHQFRVKWSAVPNAQQYGIAVKLSGKWKIQKTFDAKTTTFTSPKLTAGKTYEMVICAKINGEWDTSKLSGRIFKVTVK